MEDATDGGGTVVVDLRQDAGSRTAGGGRLGRTAAERGVFAPLTDDDDKHAKHADQQRTVLGKALHAVWSAVGGSDGADRLLRTFRHEAEQGPQMLRAEADQAVMAGQQRRQLNGHARPRSRADSGSDSDSSSLSTGSRDGGHRSLRDLESGGYGSGSASDSDGARRRRQWHQRAAARRRRAAAAADFSGSSGSSSDSDSDSSGSSDSDSGSGSDWDSGASDDNDAGRGRSRDPQRRRDLCEFVLRLQPPDLAQARAELERFRGVEEWQALDRVKQRAEQIFRESGSLTGQPEQSDLDALSVELRAYCRQRDHLRVPTLRLLEPMVCPQEQGGLAQEGGAAGASSRSVEGALDLFYSERLPPHTRCVRLSLLSVLRSDSGTAAAVTDLLRDCGGDRRFVLLHAALSDVSSNCAASLQFRLVDTEQPQAFCTPASSADGAAPRAVWVTAGQRLPPSAEDRRTQIAAVATPGAQPPSDAERRELERQRRLRQLRERQWREKRVYRQVLWRAVDPARAKLFGLVFGARSAHWFQGLLARGVESHLTDFGVDETGGRLRVPPTLLTTDDEAASQSARHWERETFALPPPGTSAAQHQQHALHGEELRVPVTVESVLLLHPESPQDYDWFVVPARRWREQRPPAAPLHRLQDLALEVCRLDRQPFCGEARRRWNDDRQRQPQRPPAAEGPTGPPDDERDDVAVAGRDDAPPPHSDLLPPRVPAGPAAPHDEPPLELYAKVTLSVYIVQVRQDIGASLFATPL